MTNYLFQLKMNFKRIMLRNKAFFFFDMMLPTIFYLLYTKILTVGIPTSTLPTWNENYLISMMVYSCMLGGIITTSNTLLDDQTSHFNLFIALKPISKIQYYSAMAIVFLCLNLISSLIICLVGIWVNHISISLPLLAVLILINLIGTIPLILLGALTALAKNPNTVNLLNNLIVFPLAIISGLWWPIQMMPTWLQKIGKIMPTYQLSLLDQNLLHKSTINFSAILIIFAWFIAIALLFFVIGNIQKRKGLSIQ
ncbi:ABC transporter permease [Companilactobacillus kimchiensis]|uniref:Transport permease protein n=1 Tax=Companilactobacillus kimchiensis TaxID=993692 RepID=A0A0R2L2U6_9LACO|nr:ABC transporter permease [Companilactobacillus kimchiensis]KRN96079.1 abc transporter, permease protein [Companilactobacillus kimchiensis]